MNLKQKIKYLKKIGWSDPLISQQLLNDYDLTCDLNNNLFKDIRQKIGKKIPIITVVAGLAMADAMMDYLFKK